MQSKGLVRPTARADATGRGLRKAILEVLSVNGGYHSVGAIVDALDVPESLHPGVFRVLDALASDLRILRSRLGFFAARPPRHAGLPRAERDGMGWARSRSRSSKRGGGARP